MEWRFETLTVIVIVNVAPIVSVKHTLFPVNDIMTTMFAMILLLDGLHNTRPKQRHSRVRKILNRPNLVVLIKLFDFTRMFVQCMLNFQAESKHVWQAQCLYL